MASQIFKVFVLIVLLSLPTSGQNPQQHLICKNVESVFSDGQDDSTVSHPQAVQGRMGKRGPAGVKGERGLPGVQGQPGSRAVVDYERIFQVIEEKHREGMREMESRFDELKRNITQLMETEKINLEATTTSTTTVTTDQARNQRCKGENGLPLNGKCYITASVSISSNLNYNQASEKCRSQGGLIAEIHSRTQQQAIHEFFRSKVPHGTHLWIAMTYQSSENNLRFRSGKEVPVDQFKWHSSYPRGSRQNVAVVLRDGFQHSGEGMFNYSEYNLQGVICEKPL